MALKTITATLPDARVRGDVNGDGAVTAEDAALVTSYIGGSTTFDAIQIWCADVYQDGNIRAACATQITRYVNGSTNALTNMPSFADYNGGWSYVKETALTGYWYYDITAADADAGMTAKAGAYQAEVLDGAVRIKTTAIPPLSAVTVTVSYGRTVDFLVTDRTQADVNYAAQLNRLGLAGMSAAQLDEWLAGLKGSYNAADLNRVGEACAELYGLITGYGYAVPGYAALSTSWTRADIPTPADMEAYLDTVAALKAVFATGGTVPGDMDGLTYTEANEIERILTLIYAALDNMAASFVYSGQPYSGQIWTQFGG